MNPQVAPERQITVKVPHKVHAMINSMGAKAGQTTTDYATTLLMAAYTARCKETGDRNLDAAVARVVVLSKDFDTARIAQYVGLSEATVTKIVHAWRNEIRGLHA